MTSRQRESVVVEATINVIIDNDDLEPVHVERLMNTLMKKLTDRGHGDVNIGGSLRDGVFEVQSTVHTIDHDQAMISLISDVHVILSNLGYVTNVVTFNEKKQRLREIACPTTGDCSS